MTQKERLTELLKTPEKASFVRKAGVSLSDTPEGITADFLLANGVIVPPCKVGDTLYFLYNSPYADKPDLSPRIYKTNDWYFEVDKAGIAINTSDIHSFNKVYDYGK